LVNSERKRVVVVVVVVDDEFDGVGDGDGLIGVR
jgi:hypothetical protein